jgi:hypothetical protein
MTPSPSPPPEETVSQFDKAVIPGEPNPVSSTGQACGRDPWFDRLTTLSEVEGESRKVAENQILLDPGSHPAPRDLAGMTKWDTASKGEGMRG